LQEADVTKGPEPPTKPEGLDGVTILKNAPVSIIPGVNSILLSLLKSRTPSITLAIQIVGLYLYVNKNDRDFIKMLKLDSETKDVELAKQEIFKAVHSWCGKVEHCREL